MGEHNCVSQGGPAFQLQGNIWWRREAQSSFHRDQPAPCPGPEASWGLWAMGMSRQGGRAGRASFIQLWVLCLEFSGRWGTG